MEHHIYLLIRVKVSTALKDTFNAAKELQSNTAFKIGSTKNVKVLKSEIIPLKTRTS